MSLTAKCCSCLIHCSNAPALQAFGSPGSCSNSWRVVKRREGAGKGEGEEREGLNWSTPIRATFSLQINPYCVPSTASVYFIKERQKEQSETLSHCITVKSRWFFFFLKKGMAGWSNFSLLFSILQLVQGAARKRGTLLACTLWCEQADCTVAFLCE